MNNDEVSVVIIDEGFAGRMLKVFDDDRANSSEITLEDWNERAWTDLFQEWFWAGFERVL